MNDKNFQEMKTFERLFIMSTFFSFLAWSCTNVKDIKSPDGNIAVEVELNQTGACNFSVYLGNEEVIQNSPLGIRLTEEGYDFTEGLELDRKSVV